MVPERSALGHSYSKNSDARVRTFVLLVKDPECILPSFRHLTFCSVKQANAHEWYQKLVRSLLYLETFPYEREKIQVLYSTFTVRVEVL